MMEIVALMLTIGAVLYHSFHAGLGGIGIVGVWLAIIISLLFRSKRSVVLGLVAGSAVVLGAMTVWRVDETAPKELFGNRAFTAHVVSVNRRLADSVLVVSDDHFDQRLQVYTSEKNILPGDDISVRGMVNPPQDFVTANGRMFGYQEYLSSQGVVGIIRNAQVALITQGGFSLARSATIVRYKVADTFSTYVSFPFDGVVAGMVVGYQGGIPQSINDLFRNTGVLHVLVLSGYNITLLGGLLALLLRPLPFRTRSIVTIIAIVCLVLVSGAGVASLRAGIMGSIALFAGLTTRTYQAFRALLVTYLIFFFISPLMLFADPGFHLSFLATTFMILVLPRIEKLVHFIPQTNHIDLRELLILAFCVPLFMLPYTMYFSGLVPLASPFANILFAIVTPVITVVGIILLLLSWMSPVANLIGILLSKGGNGIIWLLEKTNSLPSWNTPEVSGWIVVSVYLLLSFVLFKKEIKQYLWHVRERVIARS